MYVPVAVFRDSRNANAPIVAEALEKHRSRYVVAYSTTNGDTFARNLGQGERMPFLCPAGVEVAVLLRRKQSDTRRTLQRG